MFLGDHGELLGENYGVQGEQWTKLLEGAPELGEAVLDGHRHRLEPEHAKVDAAIGEGAELRGVDGTGDVWLELRQTLVSELISSGVSKPAAEKFVPHADMLFSKTVLWILEAWQRSSRATVPEQRRNRRPGIGEALGDLLKRIESR